MPADDPFHERDRLLVSADEAQHLRFEAQVVHVLRLGCQQPVDQRQRLGMPVQLIKQPCQIVAGGRESRRQLEAFAQAPLCLGVVFPPAREVGQHAQRHHIVRCVPQALPQHSLRGIQAIVRDCDDCIAQLGRIA